MSIWTPPNRPLVVPGKPKRRLISRPDLRHLVTPRLSGAKLGTNEIDYDELEVLRSWRTYEADRPSEVRYFMFELTQRNPGDSAAWHGYKAVRFARLTRVPRWLRQQGSGIGRPGFTQMSYVLAALREQGVLFVQLVTKSPDSQLVFAYGVQALGPTPEAAQVLADGAYSSLCALLDGTFQQIEYAPISLTEGERIAHQQSTWNEVAVARGRPILNTEAIGAAAILDGNRTDMETTHNQMEAFIRGMSESRKGFMLTLVTVPLSVEDMTLAVSNVAQHVSAVRSETRGMRSFTAGVALPLSVGQSAGTSSSDTHTQTGTMGTSTTDSTSHSIADGTSSSQSIQHGTSQSFAEGTSVTHTDGTSTSQALGTSATDTVSNSTAQGTTDGTNWSQGTTDGTNWSQGTTDGTNWSQGTSSATSESQGWSAGSSDSWSSGGSASHTDGSTLQNTTGSGSTTGVHGGVLGFGGSGSTTDSSGVTTGSSSQNSFGSSWGAGGSSSSGVSGGTSTSTGVSQSMGGSTAVTSTTGGSTAVSNTLGGSSGTSLTNTAGTSMAQGTSATATTGTSASVAHGTTATSTSGTSTTSGETTGVNSTATSGTSTGLSNSQSMADAYAVALSRQAGSSGSLGVVPSFGVSVSKETLDVGKQLIGDILEETMRRYVDGVEGGAYLYQMFLTAEDRDTLLAASSLLKAAFWGPGSETHRLAQPFHVITDPSQINAADPDEVPAEQSRLLRHAMAFSSYRRREPTMEIIEPFLYSSYVTCGELATFARPPVAESIGLLAVHDSAPVMAMPGDRANRDATLGFIFNGERGRISNQAFGVDVDELTHMLVSGTTGSGKTTTLIRLLSELVQVRRQIIEASSDGAPRVIDAGASILALDWMRNMRHLGSLVEPVRVDPVTGESTGRFQFFSVRDPELGSFVWNPLAVPADGMNPIEWLNATADNMVASWNLGEFGRALIVEYLDRLFSANRLEPFVLKPERRDDLGNVLRPAIVLDPIDPGSLPADALAYDELTGATVANVYSYPPLSRLIGVQHLAILVAAASEEAATVEGGRQGTSLRDRIQSLWRRVSYFGPNGQLSDIIDFDETLTDRRCLTIDDLIDPDRGLVSVIETDGLDMANRRFILGSLLLALYRSGLHKGEGCFNHNGRGPGLFVVLEEAHELFGEQGDDDDAFSASTRTALYESLHRRIRALGAKLIDVVQNPGDIPEAITSNTATVFVHRAYAKADRERVFSLLNWSNQIGQQLREYRFLGEMPIGHCIARLNARTNFLESAPVHFVTEPAALGQVTDAHLAYWAKLAGRVD